MKQSGAQIIVKLLERQGIEIIAGIPGGSNLPLYDALEESSIRHILTRHEQGAGFLAQGMARSTGRAAVCIATSGPGATNLITAIADARLDSIPLVAISGQVPTALIGTDAFQEVDMFGLTLPITKHNFFVERAADLLHIIPAAFRIAESGRPGPVAIDIPKDVQTALVDFDEWPAPGARQTPGPCDAEIINRAAAMIRQAQRPILYIGGGIVAAGAAAELTALARKNSIPVALTLMGLGCFPPEDPLSLGMLGMHGARVTNFIIEEADLLLAFGVRFDDRAIGRAREFCCHASIIHVDIDEAEINKIRASNLGCAADVGVFIRQLLPQIDSVSRSEWTARVRDLKEKYPLQLPDRATLDHPAAIVRRISEQLPKDAIVTTDVGQHQMWTAQAYPVHQPRTLLTSGGLGTMGFGMPAAIGAALANPDRKVVCISGDGSFMMNIQELATMAEHRVNVCVIIMNNNHLGLVRQQQELFYNKRYAASRFLSSPDFAAIARGFGVKAYDLAHSDDPGATLLEAISCPGPVLINAPVDQRANVFPMVPPGAANHEMIGGECYA
jgi:acetolactate synthase-1/2/3 large subunit